MLIFDRFIAKIEVCPGPLDTDCWIWIGAVSGSGYGYFGVAGKTKRAHRVAYEWLRGPIKNELDHLCRVRVCVNPWHLEDVVRKENVARGDRGPRKACPKGHPYDGKRKNGNRYCKTCNRQNANNYYAKKRALLQAG